MAMQLVWFKRDLRLEDHRPLVEALSLGDVLPLYIVEPEFWLQQDASGRQWEFCREALLDLRQAMSVLGQPLVIRCGDAVAVLERARRQLGVTGLWSHEETGNDWTYARDRRVAAWARQQSIPWREIPQFGVIRPLRSRKGWAQRWEARMAESITPAPSRLVPLHGLSAGEPPTSAELGLDPDPCPHRQQGGRQAGLDELEHFLQHRVEHYCRSISSPNKAFTGCSRLSAYLTWGCLSMREVLQRSRVMQGRGVRSFGSRLHWHCHFIQKLEDQPSIEWQDFHPFMRDLRDADADRLIAWAEGKTGVPFVDACMRALRAHGWINFRMRAMLMSFASYNLWLPWRDSGLHLARQFVDYEPGIHWSQCQMQSGSTSINTIRIYNPIKQGRDHDPDGVFIRRWCPELADVPAVHLHEPWAFNGVNPIVDCADSARQAKEMIFAIRRSAGFDRHADAIQRRHGSRRAGLPASSRRRSRGRVIDPSMQQLALDL
ncbi:MULTISPECIES: FAD-binding domain-containing protein [unclassified Synechococcus]|uniref:FAD-binding domain-containing protein n=1 Tax=unclassified Synechococcus TaxID=2626047 RepID=UPI0039B08C49